MRQQVDDEVVLSVRDTGIGISPEVLPRIFDLFVQERQALDRSEGGLGIGLTIVRSLIERHGGTVSARSDGPGKGSEFIIRLPLTQRADADVDAPPAPHAAAAAAPGAGAVRILVVDDNEDGAEMLAAVLDRPGLRHARRARRVCGAAAWPRNSHPTSPSSTLACR